MANLDAIRTTPNSGTMPSGSSSWSSFNGGSGGDSSADGFDWGGLGGIAAPFVASLFGPKNQFSGKLEDTANKALTLGTDDKAAGKNALAPVLKYLTAIAGGDPSAVLEATAPQRARVLDQYDTARKAITQQPRGGGQASGALKLEASKASDLATTASSARSEGVKELGAIGTNLNAQGAQEQETGITAAMNAFKSLSADKQQSNEGIGKAIGAAIPFLLALF